MPSVVGLQIIQISSDYQPTGMISDNNLKFLFFSVNLNIRSFDNLGDFFKFVLCPDVKMKAISNPQFLFVKKRN